MKPKALVIGVVVALLLLLLLGIPFYPLLYNKHVFDLGKLASTVHEGDQIEDVRRKFVAYYEEHKEQRPVQFSEFESETDLLRTREIPKATGLHLYDESPFDDVQLTVLFDSEGRVSEKLFVGD